MPVHIRQADTEFVIEASVPGFRPEDVEVTFEDGVLRVTVPRAQKAQPKRIPVN